MALSEASAAIVDLLLSVALGSGAAIEAAPATWTGHQFNAEALSGISRVAVPERVGKDLPHRTSAHRIDGMPVLFGELEDEPFPVRLHDGLRRYRNQANIARSWLGAEAPNLQLFLVGPRGAAGNPNWRALASEIEADDRVCRKLVWLPPRQVAESDARGFLARTFLAKPWEGDGQSKRPDLDRMGDSLLPSGWAGLIDDEGLDTDTFVGRLIQLQMDAP